VVIYPNPAQSLITVQSQEEISHIAVYSIDGKKLLEGKGKTINVESLPNNNYILIATSAEGKTITKKMVKN
jgi:hypothetical protein